LTTFGPFLKGVNNRLDDHEMPIDGENGMLRQAVNVVLSDAGRLSLRPGHELLQPVTEAHSLFATESDVLFAAGSALNRYDDEADAVTVLRNDMGARHVAYVEVNGETFYSTDIVRGRVKAGAHREWGVDNPPSLPLLTAVPGALPEGRYQVFVTFTNSYGEESGAGLAAAVSLTGSNRGIAIAGIPQPASAEVTAVNLYCTPQNGDIFYLLASLAVGVTSYTVLTGPVLGRQCRTQFLVQLPYASALAHAMGRIFGVADKYVFYTEPLAYGLCDRRKNWLPFAEEPTLIAGVQDGLYVCADKTYFWNGETLREVLPYGAVFGSLAPLTDGGEWAWTWYSGRGQIFAGNGGQVRNLQEAMLAPESALRGASMLYEANGMKQVVSLFQTSGVESGTKAASFVEMEVRRAES
jgi:hypothetical protein